MGVSLVRPIEGADASKPPLDSVRQVSWRLRTRPAAADMVPGVLYTSSDVPWGVYTNFESCWLGTNSAVVRYVTFNVYERIMAGERDDTPVVIRCDCGHASIY